MTIKLTLLKSLIIEAVKNETFHKGQFDKAVDEKAITAAYHEQAGNETYQERILGRAFYTNLAVFKTLVTEYVGGGGFDAADNVTDIEDGDTVNVFINVSDRFNKAFTDPLAKLASDFIINSMLMDWWRPVNKEQASLYAQFIERTTMAIRRCFNKMPPKAPTYKFPTAIILKYPIVDEQNGVPGMLTPDSSPTIPTEVLFQNPWHIGRGDESEITYTLRGESGNDKPVDDIIVRCDGGCCKPFIGHEGSWCLRGIDKGYSIVTLFSRHNDKVFAKFAVRIV